MLQPDGTPAPGWGISTDGPVAALALSPDETRLFVGGHFTAAAGRPRSGLAVVSTAGSGSVETAWDPAFEGAVASLALSRDGDRLWVGGSFSTVDGAARRYLVALHGATGRLDGEFDARPSDAVLTVSVSGDGLFAGGTFTSVNGVAQTNLAALDSASGSLDTRFVAGTAASGTNQVNALVVENGALYVGGTFTKVNGFSRSRIARLDTGTGAVDPSWQASINAEVKTLAVAGGRVYAGGSFTTVNGVTRHRLAALNTHDGSVTSWDPDLDSAVYHLRLSPDEALIYVAGNFSTVGGQPRARLAAVTTAAGTATAWVPKPTAALRRLALAGDGATVFVASGGSSTSGNRVQAYSTVSGSLLWQQRGDGDVTALDVSGSAVYAGGHFTQMDGQVRGHLAAFDPGSGALTGWAPSISGVHGVLELVVTDTHVLIGGEFDKVNRVVQQGFARFPHDDPPESDHDDSTARHDNHDDPTARHDNHHDPTGGHNHDHHGAA